MTERNQEVVYPLGLSIWEGGIFWSIFLKIDFICKTKFRFTEKVYSVPMYPSPTHALPPLLSTSHDTFVTIYDIIIDTLLSANVHGLC